MSFDLVVSRGPHQGKVIPIKQSTFLIGRGPQCQLRPASPEVSDRHCTLFARDGKVFVHDLNSARGTFVNLQKLEGERELANADQLKVGPLVFEVRIVAVEPAISAEDVEEIAAAELLAGDAPNATTSDTAVIALAANDTATLPTRPSIPGSSEAAQAILNEYRRRRKDRTVGNQR